MSSHRTRAVSRPPSASDLVSFHFKGEKGPAGVPESEFNGGRNAVCLLREGFRRTLHVGLGSRGRFGSDVLRQAAGVAARTLLRIGRERLAFDARSFASDAQAVVEGAWLASYKFEDFKAASARRQHALKSVEVWVGSRDLRTAADGARVGAEMAEATNLTRQVGNQPPNVMSPARLADEARRLARQLKLRCRVWDERALRREGFGGICAVGQGSANPPRLILLDMPAPNRNAPTVVVVGKAITFDTGGISIKPSDGMEKMKYDMAGGAAVLGAMRAIAQLKPSIPVTAIVPAVENMPGSRAQRPGDIVTTLSGKTVEILNTDAEGRLILCDAIEYARRLGCTHLVDAATLTGAIVVALGMINVGVFTNHEGFRSKVLEAARAEGEKMWPMPLDEEYKDLLKSAFADMANIGNRWGGAITAAMFLKEFADPVPWVHLDIAGTAWIEEAKPFLAKGPSGVGVRTFVRLVMGWE